MKYEANVVDVGLVRQAPWKRREQTRLEWARLTLVQERTHYLDEEPHSGQMRLQRLSREPGSAN